MALPRLTALLFVPAFVAACAAVPPPSTGQVHGQPIYDKLGGQIGCESGVYIRGAKMQDQCLPPDDCDPQRTGTAANRPCLPPPDGCDPRLTRVDPNCFPGRGDDRPNQPNNTPTNPLRN